MKTKTWGEMTWPEMMIHMGHCQAQIFRNNNFSWMECLVNGKSQSYIMNSIYRSIVGKKIIIPIEELPVEEKTRLFDVIKEFAPKSFTKERYIESCKSLYALEYFLKFP